MKTVSIHAIAWALFITYEVLVTIVMGGKFYFRDYVFFYTLNICLFYFNADVVFRYASNLKNIAFVIVPLVILELTVYVILGETFNHILNEDPKGWSAFWNDALKALWRAIYFVGLSTGYWFFKRTIVKTKEANKFKILQLETEATKMQIEKDLAVSRVEYLQSQINPHFLFNTLNYIYNSVEKIAPDASNSILLLSEIMHYALSEIGEDGKVPLSDEIAHIERYIALTQLRFCNSLYVTLEIQISKDCHDCRIPPLLLLTFIENVFKHGDLTDPAKPASISINCKNQVLSLNSQNAKRKSLIPSTRHIGITNAQTRLNLYYTKEDFELSLDNTLTQYIVTLTIKL